MLSKQPLPSSNNNLDALPDKRRGENQALPLQQADFLQRNAEELNSIELFAELSTGFTIAFMEVNTDRDRQIVIEYLKNSDQFPTVQWVTIALASENLEYFGLEVQEKLQDVSLSPDCRPVLLISGLERSIKGFGEYPPILTNLNMERDIYPHILPYPIVLLLPSYAITRCARYAPDFWSWKSIEVRLYSELPDQDLNSSPHPIITDTTTVQPVSLSRFNLLTQLLAENTDPTIDRARLLHQLGNAYCSIYENDQAETAYRSALDIYDNFPVSLDRSETCDGLARLYYLQGKYSGSLQLWQQALAIQQEIGDRQGEAASLHQLSMIYESLGDYPQALSLSQQSIEIYREISDRQGEASSLAQMATIAYQQGNTTLNRELRLQAAKIRGSIGEYGGLIITLMNLGANNEPDAIDFLAQALWLNVYCATNLKDTIGLISAIYQKIPASDRLESLLGATALHFCHTRTHPELAQLTERSHQMINHAANQQGIETPEDIAQWFTINRLNDPEYFFPALLQELAAIIGDSWLFDITAFLPEK